MTRRAAGRQFHGWLSGAALMGVGLLAGCVQVAPAPPPGAAAHPAAATGDLNKVNSIKLNGVEYKDTDSALAAYRAIEDKIVSGVAKVAQPIKGRARIVIPDHDRMRPLVAQKYAQLLKRNVTGPALDFEIELDRTAVQAMADALVKAQAFEQMSLVELNDVREPDFDGADYVVWYQVRTLQPDNTGLWIGHWQIRHTGSPITASAAMDQGTAAGTPRYNSFVESVRQGAIRVAGGTSSVSTGASGSGSAASASSGSGFIVNADGNIVTNEHVVRSCTAVQAIDALEVTHEASVVAKDAANDLAILKIAGHTGAVATFREGEGPRPGDSVVVMGYPLGDLLSANAAVTTGSLTALAGLKNDTRLMQLSAPIQLGNSGGPVLDGDGEVIGVVSGTLNGMALALLTGAVPQNVNFAVKASLVRAFLDDSNIAYSRSHGRHEHSSSDIGAEAAKYTVRILCRH